MTEKEISKETRDKLLKKMDNIPYRYYTNHDFKPPWEEERRRALNCSDSRVEDLKNRAKQKLIIREILEQGE